MKKISENIKRNLYLIILVEIIVVFQFNLLTISENISSISFFVSKEQNQQEFIKVKQNLVKQELNDQINTKVINDSIIDLSIPNPTSQTNNFINHLLDNHSAALSLQSFQSQSSLDFRLAYLIGLLFIFIPTLVYWLAQVKHKENQYTEIDKRKLSLYSLGLLILALSINFVVVYASGVESISNTQNLNSFIQENNYIAFVFIVLFAPIVEELLFRGVLLRYFIDKKKFILGSIIITVEFILAHYGYFQTSIELSSLIVMGVGFATLSLLLCWTYYKFNSIIAPIFLHMINNLLGYLFTLN